MTCKERSSVNNFVFSQIRDFELDIHEEYII